MWIMELGMHKNNILKKWILNFKMPKKTPTKTIQENEYWLWKCRKTTIQDIGILELKMHLRKKKEKTPTSMNIGL